MNPMIRQLKIKADAQWQWEQIEEDKGIPFPFLKNILTVFVLKWRDYLIHLESKAVQFLMSKTKNTSYVHKNHLFWAPWCCNQLFWLDARQFLNCQ